MTRADFSRTLLAGARLTATILLLLIPLNLAGCGPANDDGVSPVPEGSTTDTVTLQVNWMGGRPADQVNVHLQLRDTDNIDPATGESVIRREVTGLTDAAGRFSRTMSYHGQGDLAADRVVVRISFDGNLRYNNLFVLQNHLLSRTITISK